MLVAVAQPESRVRSSPVHPGFGIVDQNEQDCHRAFTLARLGMIRQAHPRPRAES
jgi:hypothetical protein